MIFFRGLLFFNTNNSLFHKDMTEFQAVGERSQPAKKGLDDVTLLILKSLANRQRRFPYE